METSADRTDDFVPGDPAVHVAGKPDEQSARIHAPLPPVPRTAKHILADIRLRMQELKAMGIDEYPALVEAQKVLKGI